MSEYKYPFIPPKYYDAVMAACQYIRKYRWFHKAIEWAASEYHVDEAELERHVRARQAAGQKGKKGHSAGKKYKWFVVAEHGYSDEGSQSYVLDLSIEKGLTPQSVVRKYSSRDYYSNRSNYTGSYYDGTVHHTAIMQFDNYEDAANWKNENRDRLVNSEKWFRVQDFTTNFSNE